MPVVRDRDWDDVRDEGAVYSTIGWTIGTTAFGVLAFTTRYGLAIFLAPAVGMLVVCVPLRLWMEFVVRRRRPNATLCLKPWQVPQTELARHTRSRGSKRPATIR